MAGRDSRQLFGFKNEAGIILESKADLMVLEEHSGKMHLVPVKDLSLPRSKKPLHLQAIEKAGLQLADIKNAGAVVSRGTAFSGKQEISKILFQSCSVNNSDNNPNMGRGGQIVLEEQDPFYKRVTRELNAKPIDAIVTGQMGLRPFGKQVQ